MRDHTNVRTNASFSHTLSPELKDLRITMIKLYYQFIPETLTSSRIKERKLNKMQPMVLAQPSSLFFEI